MILSDEEILQVMTTDVVEGDYYLPHSFARAIEAAIIQKIGEPVCYHYTEDCYGVADDFFGHPGGYYPSDATPLYALPEVKK